MHGEEQFLILVAVAAFVLPLLATRLRTPAVVLEILFGILIGPAVLGLVERSDLLSFLAELGFILLLFLSGFEIDFGRLERQGPAQLVAGFVGFALTLGASFLAADLLGLGAFTGFMLATTSLGLVVPTLRGGRQTDTPLGQAVLIQGIMADFLSLLGVTVFAVLVESGVGPELFNVPLLFVASLAALLVVRRLAWWSPERFERLFAADDPEELGIRASLALMFLFVGLAAALGIEAILGAFLAGVVIALVFRHRGVLEEQLNGFAYGFLIPIFFINVGVGFELGELGDPAVLRQGLGLLVAAVAVKVVPALIYMLRGLSFRETLAAGALLTPGLSLIIAVAEVGVRLDLIDAGTEAAVILLAIVTAALGPLAFRLLAPAANPGAEVSA